MGTDPGCHLYYIITVGEVYSNVWGDSVYKESIYNPQLQYQLQCVIAIMEKKAPKPLWVVMYMYKYVLYNIILC